MNISPAYIEAAQAGIADALKTATVSPDVAAPTYTLGLQAVRNCSASKGSEPESVLSACYIIGSIHDQGIHDLMKVVNPGVAAAQRVAFLLELSSFKTASTGITEATKREVASACDDILLAFHATVMADQAVHLHSLLEKCFAQLLQAKGKESKQRSTIKALLEAKARADGSRRRVEDSRAQAEKLIQVLGKQLGLEEKSSDVISQITTVSDEH